MSVAKKATPSSAPVKGDADSAPAHDRRMAVLEEDGVQIKIELRGLTKYLKRSAGQGTAFLPLEGRVVSNGPDNGQRKDVTLWGDVATNFLAATRYLRPTGETPLTVTFRGRNRMVPSYNAANDSKSQSWRFNGKAFAIDWSSPAAQRPFPASQRMSVLGIEQRTLESTGATVHMVLAKSIDGEQRKQRFKMPTSGDWEKQLAVLSKATPIAPVEAVFQGEWRMIDHNGGKVASFRASACTEIDAPETTKAKARAPRQAPEASLQLA